MSAAHTPGPWMVSEDRREHAGQSYVAGYNIESEVERVVGDEGISGGSNDEANARLIAAAPELLEAAIALRLAQRDYMANRGDNTKGAAVAEAATVLDAAIQKATQP